MKLLPLLLSLTILAGCAAPLAPLKTVDGVDIKRFMGPWYIIACIPTFIETDSYNGVETYRLDPDGTIDTVFTFNQGGFDGPQLTGGIGTFQHHIEPRIAPLDDQILRGVEPFEGPQQYARPDVGGEAAAEDHSRPSMARPAGESSGA